jgi:hypothetical protein
MKNTTYLVLWLTMLMLWLWPLQAQAQYVPNLGPNIQYPQPPANPVAQSIHPK